MKEHRIEIKYTEAQTTNELTTTDAHLVSKAREASKNAWAPYSNFNVGAAVLLETGEIIVGNNQENAAFPSGLCAERVALFAANANYPNSAIKAIAISATNHNGLVPEPVKPCGACRQALLETELRFGKPIHMILDSANSTLLIDGINNLLPLSFGKNNL